MTDQATHTSDCAAMGAMAEAHKALRPFAGTFKATGKMWMGPGEPMVTTGVMTSELEMDGRYLRQVYKGDANDGPFPNFEGRGFMGYNTVSKKFEGFWIDSASTFMQFESGDVDASGKVWTMVGEMTNPEDGKPMRKKSIITLKDNDHHSMEIFFPGPDGADMKAMEIQYARA